MAINRKHQKAMKRTAFYGLVVLIVVASLGPFVWQFISSISTDKELLNTPPHWIPQNPTFERYHTLLSGQEDTARLRIGTSLDKAAQTFRNAGRNSLIVATITTLLCLVLGTLAAYSFTRLNFKGRDALFFLILGARMMPPISLIVPLYLIMRKLGLMDTHLVLIITYTSFILPLIIWIMSAFFRTVPWEIEEAAMIDGCSEMGALTRVIIPLAAPGLTASTIISFLFSWNEFFFALIFTNTDVSKTLPKAISEFSSQFGAGLDYGMVMTGGVLVSLPTVLLALAFQKYLVRGLTGGAVKG